MKEEEKIPLELLKKIKKIEIRSRLVVNEAMSGGYNSVFRGYGMEFQEVREYSIGDDFRRIDWNVTARHNNLYIKTFKEERQLNVMLLLDISGSLGFGSKSSTKHDKMVETSAILALTAMDNQDKIGAVFFTDKVEKVIIPTKNKNTILRLLREILFIKPQSNGTDINNAIDFAVENMKRRGVIFILSDFLAEVSFKKIFIASKKHDIIPVVLTDEFEEYPINLGLVDMVDNESGELMLVDTSSESYKKFVEERRARKAKFFLELKKLNIEPLIIDTGADVELPIMRYFEKRRKKIR
ncbi:MAG TPA: DUF58 domain-containing protein [Spirochaetota bacterium]|nr:DUF58 domain-containing protein [Spirochaetota bacterium]HOS33902.1 DUF58 domain-containing protein [Spirochaetota bacterium]HOS55553.1 DUF58 domain-containing protein [Spirochaetota bacterium]HPK63041.1 DUF58 domain-containing protein [Spirochaetota bacterium]HQF77522.1 DUF58 domain-containing protein [Spirochaetota bacterium]